MHYWRNPRRSARCSEWCCSLFQVLWSPFKSHGLLKDRRAEDPFLSRLSPVGKVWGWNEAGRVSLVPAGLFLPGQAVHFKQLLTSSDWNPRWIGNFGSNNDPSQSTICHRCHRTIFGSLNHNCRCSSGAKPTQLAGWACSKTALTFLFDDVTTI